MKKTILLMILSGGIVLAQNEQRPAPPVPPVMKALDADGDGALSADEIAEASAVLAELDADANGQLSEEEVRPAPPEEDAGGDRPRRKPPKLPVMDALDQDGDGVLSEDELSQASASLAKLDENESGSLEAGEIEPERPERGPKGGPEGGERPPRPPRGRH